MDEIIKGISDMMELIVITRGRDKIITLDNMPENISRYFIIVTDEESRDNLQGRYDNEFKVIPHEDICELYDKIYKSHMGKYVLILHDNIRLYTRFDEKYNFVKKQRPIPSVNNYYLKLLMEMVTKLDDGYGLIGLHHYAFNISPDKFTDNSKTFAVTAINTDLFYHTEKSKLLGSGRYQICEDNLAQCSFAESGIKTGTVNSFSFNKPGGWNSKGGLSKIRTISMVDRHMDQLIEDFGEKYVKKRYVKIGAQHNYIGDGQMPTSTIYLSKKYRDAKNNN